MRLTALTVLSTSLLAACGGGSASVKLELDNATARGPSARVAAAAGYAPGDAVVVPVTRLDLKLVAVYLSEDVDPVTQNNTGATAMIYLNPECGGDIEHCGPAASMARQITTFFDFAQPTSAVNAALNAQRNDISPGTYRYARMEFCKYGPGDQPNLRWQAGAMAAPAEGFFNACGVTSAPFATPLVLKDGDAVSVTLAYDLAQAAMSGTAPGGGGYLVDAAGTAHFFQHCADEGATRTCLEVPAFVPSPGPAP